METFDVENSADDKNEDTSAVKTHDGEPYAYLCEPMAD